MQGLSAFRAAHCCTSLGGSHIPSPRQQVLLHGFQQRSILFRRRREAFSSATRRLKSSPQQILQDESATEEILPPLAQENASTKLAQQEVSTNLALEDFSTKLAEQEEDGSIKLADQENSTNDGALKEGPKVNVKFILEKKCHFGQRFNVVGNIPLLGKWEVKAAIPMEWSEGDVWTAESDIPAEKEVEFKFVLTGESGEIEWQPGSNRVFSTVEGMSPLVVNEAWKALEGAAADEAMGESSNRVEDTASSDKDGLLVTADIKEDAVVDEVVKALESKNGERAPKSEPDVVKTLKSKSGEDAPKSELEVVKALESKNGEDAPKSDSETVPEVPLAALNVAATSVKTALGVDAAA